ncbi:anaerobic ribonucleoside-triphosphate reductase activating protein [Actinotalea sp.]|uniref:anaerobic ribonucleoside-triphosphate reductase activating protein n=1 Tax=Actinotalea sp. TaxID=1872145 RepID=UPI0035673799
MSAQTIQSVGTAGRNIDSADRLEIAGWTTTPEVDLWPGHRALTVLLQGCPWMCSNCEQPELRDTLTGGKASWREVREAIVSLSGEIDGVVLSGGEPTRQDGLADAIEQVRALGLPVVLHTSGAYPRRLVEILPLVDRVVFDVRAPATLYRATTGVGSSAHQVFTSLRATLESGVDLQVRSCVDPAIVGPADVERLRADLAALGVRDHVVTERAGSGRPSTVRRVPVGAGRVPVRG